jgi:YVTN family beta-propeller protein
VGVNPYGVAASPGRVYVTNYGSKNVSVIATNTTPPREVARIPVEGNPGIVAVSPDGREVFVGLLGGASVDVIATATNRVVDNIGVLFPFGIAVDPDGSLLYVTTPALGTVSAFFIPTRRIIGVPIRVGVRPQGVAWR